MLNRAAFTVRMEERIARALPGALLILDVDGFKSVNDAFGHGAGDQALTEIAASLRLAIRKEDLLGRLGGDEFMIFLTGVKVETEALGRAQKLRREGANHRQHRRGPLPQGRKHV